MGVPLEDVVCIILVVRLLDTSAGRGIETGHCEPDAGTVRKIDRFLDQTFAEGAASYDLSPVVILNGT